MKQFLLQNDVPYSRIRLWIPCSMKMLLTFALLTLGAASGWAQTVTGLSLSPSTVQGGATSTATVTISALAPSGGTAVRTLNSSLLVYVTVTVPAGSTTTTFPCSTTQNGKDYTNKITASLNGSQQTVIQTVLGLRVATVSAGPMSIPGGQKSTGRVTLSADVPVTYDNPNFPGGGHFPLNVSLSSSNSAVASVPAGVGVPEGRASATFVIATRSVAVDTPVVLTASLNGVSMTATVLVKASIPFDFSGSGHNDLVFQNSNTGQLVTWLMNGTDVLGGTGFNVQPAAGWNAVGAADFNNDGQPDMIFQNATSGQVVLWYFRGTTLLGGEATSFAPSAQYKVVATGDFNGDGNVDLVFQNQTTGEIVIWFMNGAQVIGGVTLPYIPAAGWNVVGAGDFNGDGNPDLLLQNFATGQLVVWFMHGSSYFDKGVVSTNPTSVWLVRGIADYNGDGTPDIVFQNRADNTIAVWFMNGITVSSAGFTSAVPQVPYRLIGPR